MLLLFLTLLDGLCSHVRSRLVNFASEGSAMTLRNALYEHLQNVPYDYHKHTSVGDLVQRCSSDVEIVRRFVSMQFIEIVRTIARVSHRRGDPVFHPCAAHLPVHEHIAHPVPHLLLLF